jgi:hypothetical protein
MMNTLSKLTANHDLVIVYDGECPFCSNYVNFLKIRGKFGKTILVNARVEKSVVRELQEMTFDINKGMAVSYNSIWYYGPDAINFLSSVNKNEGVARKIHNALFSTASRANFFYPILVFCRNITLKILGRKKIQ